jgi:hypothetical protein
MSRLHDRKKEQKEREGSLLYKVKKAVIPSKEPEKPIKPMNISELGRMAKKARRGDVK